MTAIAYDRASAAKQMCMKVCEFQELVNQGKSDAQIQAITGHSTAAMAAHYRRGADQRKLAGKDSK